MTHSKGPRRDSTRSNARTMLTEDEGDDLADTHVKAKRTASVYDAVGGKVGLNGLLTQEQLLSVNALPHFPEEVLLRRIGAPDEIPYGFYDADKKLPADQNLPGSDLLKAIHTYASDFFTATTKQKGQKDYRSFDGTALLALGILLEEASKNTLGQNGDMALVEPDGLEHGLPESALTNYQITGKVKPHRTSHQRPDSKLDDEPEEEEAIQSPRKKRRARTGS